MAKPKTVRNYSTLAKFREVVESYRAYDAARREAEKQTTDAPTPTHEALLLQELERKVLAWLDSVFVA